MDSTTVQLMARAAKIAQERSDSIGAATRSTAEWILLRHDLVLVSMVAIPSLALVVCFFVWRSQSV